jgi:hypothetical protein
MTDKQREHEFEERTRAAFEASVDALDGRTRSKLTQARHAALAELNATGSRTWTRARMVLAGATAAGILAVWIGFGDLGSPPAGELLLEDFDIAAEGPNLELLQDVEFYAWIADQPGQSG